MSFLWRAGLGEVSHTFWTRVCLKTLIDDEGLIVAVFYLFFGVIRIFTPAYIWYRLLAPTFAVGWIAEKKKSKAWWQDLYVLAHLVISVVVYVMGSELIRSWIPVYLMVDSLVYQMNMLWFDHIEFTLRKVESKIWSPRRIFFQGIINFAESVLLFAFLYQSSGTQNPFSSSLKSATTAGSVDSLIWPWQVGVSLFYILVVFSVMVPASSPNARGGRGELTRW